MDKLLLTTFCFLSIIALSYSVEHNAENVAGGSVYDLVGLFGKITKHFQNSMHLKESNVHSSLQFNVINENFEFRPLRDSPQNSSRCLDDISYTLNNTKSDWALELIDSFGKPESGIKRGNLKWVGDYEECIGVRAYNPNSSSTIGNFKGKYCSMTWSLSSSLKLNIPYQFVTGVCVPDSCSAKELEEDAPQLLHMAGIYPVLKYAVSYMNVTNLTCKPRERHLNTAAIVIIALLSVFSAMVVAGSCVTVVKYFKKVLHDFKKPSFIANISENRHVIIGDDNNILQKNVESDDEVLLQDHEPPTKTNGWLQNLETILSCFCIFKNGAKVLNTDSSEGELLCLHGIRFLSMSWVILGHSYIFGIAEMKNMAEIQPLITNFPFQALLQAFYSVDSFFVLSGFLLAYLTMKEFSKNKGMGIKSWAYFYIHRYLRLTPIYMALLGFSATVYLYLGSGPYWPDMDYEVACRDLWWRNLLYINNFDVEAGQCMGWSWYLANDMQFFVISPLFLITLWRWPKIGYSLLAVFLCATTLSNFFITYHFDLVSGMAGLINEKTLTYDIAMAKFTEYFIKLYVKPYTRISPYLVGILTGYLLFKRKENNRPKHSLVFLCVGWTVATSVTLVCVYGLYNRVPTLIESCFFNAFSRTCFAMGLSWVIYVCLIGQGGLVNHILSYKLFIPLSRLTYAAYLIHPMIIGGYFASLKSSLVFAHPTLVILFLGFMVVTYALALPVALALESPIVSLEKLVRKKFVKKQEVVN